MGSTSNHKPGPSNDTDQRQQATGHQTANMCGGGEAHIVGLRRGEVHVLNVNSTKKSEKVDTLGLNLMCLRTIVRVLLFIGAFVMSS